MSEYRAELCNHFRFSRFQIEITMYLDANESHFLPKFVSFFQIEWERTIWGGTVSHLKIEADSGADERLAAIKIRIRVLAEPEEWGSTKRWRFNAAWIGCQTKTAFLSAEKRSKFGWERKPGFGFIAQHRSRAVIWALSQIAYREIGRLFLASENG